MGAVCTNMVVQEDDATRRSDNIDKVNKEENKKNSKELKILLLGTGEAGKSTIMKQTQIIYDKGFADDFKMDVKPIIYKQVVKNMKVLIRESGKYGDGPIDMECANRINQVEERILDPLEFENQFSPQVWEDLESLWKNPAIKKTYENGYKFILDDTTGYFLEKLSVLKNRDYIPDNNDLLRSRTKTTAIVDRTFESGDNKFRILDVGGQRSERRKWAHCFSEVNALIFVVAISEYDQCLREDNSTRRLDESLKVYEDTINNKYFKDKVIILCFNKMDIFEKKSKNVISIFTILSIKERQKRKLLHLSNQNLMHLIKTKQTVILLIILLLLIVICLNLYLMPS